MQQKTQEITLSLDDPNIIIKDYKIRTTGQNGRSIETTIPREVFAREAKKKGFTVEQGTENLRAVWRYNGFHGLHLSFEPKEK